MDEISEIDKKKIKNKEKFIKDVKSDIRLANLKRCFCCCLPYICCAQDIIMPDSESDSGSQLDTSEWE